MTDDMLLSANDGIATVTFNVPQRSVPVLLILRRQG